MLFFQQLPDVDNHTNSFWHPRTMAYPTIQTIRMQSCTCSRWNAMNFHKTWLVWMVCLGHVDIATIVQFVVPSCPLVWSSQWPNRNRKREKKSLKTWKKWFHQLFKSLYQQLLVKKKVDDRKENEKPIIWCVYRVA